MAEAEQPQLPDTDPSHIHQAVNSPVPSPTLATKTKSGRKDKDKNKDKDRESTTSAKRRCVSTACIACRKRKSKCDGNTPSCAACASVYGTECVYDPNSDHRRKGVYKKDIDNLKTRNSTLQTLIQAILNYPEDEVLDLVKQIRTCESLDDVAESILSKNSALVEDNQEDDEESTQNDVALSNVPKFEKELSGKLGELRLENGSVSVVGGTSNLMFVDSEDTTQERAASTDSIDSYQQQDDPLTSWTEVTSDPELVVHLLNMYFTWHYTYFTTLSKSLFYRDFLLGKPPPETKRKNEYCTSLLVNAMLALGCHFTSWPSARADPQDSATAGDHFFREAKRLILENDEHENPKLATVQALALMSVREAGCGREARGWVYSGMSFRMAYDLGLNIDSVSASHDEQEVDAKRITVWGSFLFDKCWSNYLGRQPQFPASSISVPKFEVFPMEDADLWTPYLDSGQSQAHSQPSRTRAVALQISSLCEISSDLLLYFYHPTHVDKPLSKQAELKKLSELHTRLEAWRKDLPKELEPKEGQLPSVLVLHMFFHLLFIHVFRPFLKYKQSTSPLPSNVSPRKFCTQAASTISKLVRLYKRTYGLRQIVNIAVYILHSACTIHLLNLPEKNAERDIAHGLKHLEEISESWICARKTIGILQASAKRWNIQLPKDAEKVLQRVGAKLKDQTSPKMETPSPQNPANPASFPTHSHESVPKPTPNGFTNGNMMGSAPSLETTQPNASIPVASQSTSDLSGKVRRQSFALPQMQQNLWNQDRMSRGQLNSQTSPSVLFGGVDALINDSQDWWYRDQSQLYANWNSMDQDTSMMNPNGMDGTSPGYGMGSYAINGINGGNFVA
ncbi:MAG: hypothetical protein Q9191_004564 [Dirinaria sp. TL-2023a]